MNNIREKIDSYVEDNKERLISELQTFLRQPSISTENIGMEECAGMILRELKNLGMQSEILTLEGAFPAVYGFTDESEKKLMIYGHYDVQSPEPIEKWSVDPFSAEIVDGHIIARGATDDKGNLFANIKAAETYKAITGKLPKGLKFFFEGEEEIGSPNLARYYQDCSDKLHADVSIICDRGIHETGRPQIYLGNKGLMVVEILSKGVIRDVHSGHAPLIPNAVFNLVRLLKKMRDEQGNIIIPGYLDDIMNIPEDELALLHSIPFNQEEFKDSYGVDVIPGEPDKIKILEKLIYTPTCNISGIKGGWTGERSKTIIPCEGWVRLDMRLVRNQTPENAERIIRRFIDSQDFGDFEVKFTGYVEPYTISPKNDLVQLSMRLAEEIYGKPPVVWPLLDGSGPMYMFPKYLNSECFIIGLGAPFSTANTHSHDENISINQYLTGIKLMANIYHEYLEIE